MIIRTLFAAFLICFVSSHAKAAGSEIITSSWLLLEYKNSSETEDGSSSSSNGRQSLIETVVDRTAEKTVLEYDYPHVDNGRNKAGFWYFPAKITVSSDGTRHLTDRSAVEQRIAKGIEERGIPVEACGKRTHGGGFPFKYDCDPDSVLKQIEPFILEETGIYEGATYSHPAGLLPVSLRRDERAKNTLLAVFQIAPDVFRSRKIEQDRIYSEMMNEAFSPIEAQRHAEQTDYVGTISVRFELDEAATVSRRIETTIITESPPDGPAKTRQSQVSVTRMDVEDANERFDQ